MLSIIAAWVVLPNEGSFPRYLGSLDSGMLDEDFVIIVPTCQVHLAPMVFREIEPHLFCVYLRLSTGASIFGFRPRGTRQVCSADVALDLRLTAFDFKVCILTPPGFSTSCFIQKEDRIRSRIQGHASQNGV